MFKYFNLKFPATQRARVAERIPPQKRNNHDDVVENVNSDQKHIKL